jgi:hypothetical protein
MLENRKVIGMVETVSLSSHPPSLKKEKDEIIDKKPKHNVLESYFEKVVCKFTDEDDSEDDD